jgi:TRAP-type C4-dicarboxylate transport system substrate-binding protein
MRKLLLAAACAVAMAGATLEAAAKDSWKIGTAAQPGSVLYDIIAKFIADFNASQNDIALEFQFIGNEQEMFQQVIRGRIQMGASSFAGGAIAVPEGTVMNTPYLWKNDEERAWVTDNYAVPIAKKLYAEKGLELVSVADVGWNDVVCNFACITPESVKGQKMRVSPSPASRVFFQYLGVNGVQMPLSELWPGLQNGLVRGADLPFLFYVTTPAAQSAPHYVLTRHYHHPSVWVVNKGLFDGLKPDVRDKMMKTLPDANWARKQVSDTEGPRMREFVAKGGFVHELTAEQREAWAKVVRPGQPEMIAAIGGQAQQFFDAVMEGKKVWAEKHEKK